MRVAVATKKGPQLFCDDRLIDDVINQAPRTNAGPSWHRLKSSIVVYGSQQKELRPLFRSHGAPGGVLTDSNNKKSAAYYSDYANWHPKYKMALGIIFACHSATARGDFSTNAIFWGKTGILVPHGLHLFGPTIEELVPPGAQGTNQ